MRSSSLGSCSHEAVDLWEGKNNSNHVCIKDLTKRNLIYKLKDYCIYSNIFIYICLFVLDCIAAALHFAKVKPCLLQFKMYSDLCIIASHS